MHRRWHRPRAHRRRHRPRPCRRRRRRRGSPGPRSRHHPEGPGHRRHRPAPCRRRRRCRCSRPPRRPGSSPAPRAEARARLVDLVLQRHAGQPAAPGLAEQPGQLGGRGLDGQTLGAHVGDAVARRVGEPDTRRPADVEAQAVGRAEARPLADQHDDAGRAQRRTDLVTDRHPALVHQHDGRQRPVRQVRPQRDDQRHGVAVHGQGGEPVGDDQREVEGRGGAALLAPGGQPLPRGVVEPPSEVGPLQVDVAVGGGAGERQRLVTRCAQRRGHRVGVEGQVHGVAGARVSEAELELGGGGHGDAGAAQRDARGGEAPQRLPGRGDHAGQGGIGRSGIGRPNIGRSSIGRPCVSRHGIVRRGVVRRVRARHAVAAHGIRRRDGAA